MCIRDRLWGHGLKDVWGLGDQSFPLGLWAAENLLPEGPLPAIRIGNQPYGLLPATSLRRWVTQPGDPGVESKLTSVLRDARRNWAAAASAAGTSVGADTDRLLDLIGRVPSPVEAPRVFPGQSRGNTGVPVPQPRPPPGFPSSLPRAWCCGVSEPGAPPPCGPLVAVCERCPRQRRRTRIAKPRPKLGGIGMIFVALPDVTHDACV